MSTLSLKSCLFLGLIVPAYAATSTTTGTVPLITPTTTDTTAPTPPILILPPHESTTADPRPEFVWYQSTDPNGNTVTYTLYLNGISTYVGISDLGNSSSSNYITRLEDNTIHLSPTYPLSESLYYWYVTASDLSGNTSRSVTWSFIISTTYPFLTATIAKLETRLPLSYLAVGLLALAIALLLIFLWKKRYNLILLDTKGDTIPEAIVYHSIPSTHTSRSPILVTKLAPLSYLLSPRSRGRLYIRHLGRYSTLTIRLDQATYIMSLCARRKLYTIILG